MPRRASNMTERTHDQVNDEYIKLRR